MAVVESNFSVFNSKANQKIFNEFVAKQKKDREFIEQLQQQNEELKALLMHHHISIPETISQIDLMSPRQTEQMTLKAKHKSEFVMDDGSVSSATEVMKKIQQFMASHKVQVQFKNLTFWNMVPQRVSEMDFLSQ
jgi:hypothetical protein